jgi:PhnB protein
MKKRRNRTGDERATTVLERNVDLTYWRAVDSGALSIEELAEDIQGDRVGTIVDPFGNQWTSASRVEQVSMGETHRRLARR